MEQITHFLKQIELINYKYQKVLNNKHSNFNVFSILRNEGDEEKLHSAFLGELLNPHGSHGMGTEFFNLFICMLKLEFSEIEKLSFNEAKTRVEIEYNVGSISKDYNTGGRIDILITDTKTELAIENKIYASDQHKQLKRYRNYLNGVQNGALLYLNLDGSLPSADSTEGLKEGLDYQVISYENHVANWLVQCKEKSVNHPLLRETIQQYLNLIQKLTGTGTNTDYMTEIAQVITQNKEYLKLAIDVEKSLAAAKTNLQKLFWDSLKQSIANHVDVVGGQVSAIHEFNMDRVERFYNNVQNNKWLGYNLDLGAIEINNTTYQVIFRFEIEQNLYFGFVLGKHIDDQISGCREPQYLPLFELINGIQGYTFTREDKWVGWCFPKLYQNHELNFKNFDTEAIFSLTNKTARNIITDNIAKEANEVIKKFEELLASSMFRN